MGEAKEAWLADYTGGDGKRHAKTFDRKKDAEAFISNAKVEVRHGIHTADSDSVTVAKAAAAWITTCTDRGLERATLEGYAAHAKLHIVPYIGRVKLSHLSVPMIRAFEDKLRAEGRSQAITRKIMTSLRACSAMLWNAASLRATSSASLVPAGMAPPIVRTIARRAISRWG